MIPSDKTLRVCAYCRVSTDNNDQANSYASQVQYFTEYIQKNPNWTFVCIYADEGISGTSTKKRVQFNQMIADGENRLFDLILTKEVSRFARNTVDTLDYTRRLKALGIGVYFTNDNIYTLDNDGELRLTIMASIAQDESRKTSERVKWGQTRRMEQGIVFGRDLLGYKVEHGKLILVEEEAKIVRLIFDKFLREGKGTHVIARELREAGIQPKRVREWSNVVILRVLRNEKYVGDLCQKKTYTPDFLTHGKKYNRGHEEKVYIKDHHPDIAIIDREIWDATQAELARRSPSAEAKSKHSNRYWCSGKITCGDCGSRFISFHKKLKNGTIYKSWRCINKSRHGGIKTDPDGVTVGCNNSAIADKALRYIVVYCINVVLNQREEIKAILAKLLADEINSSKPIDKSSIEKDITEIKAKKIKLIDLAVSGIISESDVKTQNGVYDEELKRLSLKLIDTENSIVQQKSISSQFNLYLDKLNKLTEIDDFDNDEILKSVFEKAILFSGNRVIIYLSNVPFGIQLEYKTSGRMRTFKVDIQNCNVLYDAQN